MESRPFFAGVSARLQMSSVSKTLAIGCLAALSLAAPCLARDDSPKKQTLWTTGSALMPGWGLYTNSARYGGSELLGQHTAWGTGRLTWVARIPADGVFQVWVRQYGGYGSVEISVNEKVVGGGAGGVGDGTRCVGLAFLCLGGGDLGSAHPGGRPARGACRGVL